MNINNQNILIWLQNWYYQYCDGDWEHNETINISTIDNPGWFISIDLEGTDCENKSFQNIEKEISENDWVHCFLRDGKFEGAGGPCNLFEILSIFKEWATACCEGNE
jgi:hypothetical protein